MNKTKIVIIGISVLLLGAACAPIGVSNKSDGGFWITESKGASWDQKVDIYADRSDNKTIGNVDVKKIIFSPNDERKIFLLTDKNGLWFSWNQGNNWDLLLGSAMVSDIAINLEDSKKIYAAVGSSIAVSLDEGSRWSSTYISDDPIVKITGLILDKKNPSTIYAATSIGTIIVSDDSGISWRLHSETGEALKDMQYHSNQENAIYAIAQGKGLAISRDSAKTWEFFDGLSQFAGSSEARDYEFIPSGIIYASEYGLLRSLNFGKDWVSLPLISGKTDPKIYAIAVAPNDPLKIFYGTKSNLYYSSDGGFNWIPRPLPTTRATSDLIIHPKMPDMLFMGVKRLK